MLIKKDAQHKRKKSCNRLRDNTTNIWRFKKLCFWKNLKKCSIDSTPQVKLS